MVKTLEIPSHLVFPQDLALLSRKVKELKPGEKLEVLFPNSRGEKIKQWCSETGNRLLLLENGRALIERGKGFHGVCLNEKLSFYLWGVKLHTSEFWLKVTGRYPRYLFNFISINEALKSLNILPKLNVKYKLLPSPKEIEGYCGFAVGFDSLQNCEKTFLTLLKTGLGVEIIFERRERGFKILKGAWEYSL